ncbi:MAG TPA: trypsin-like serine protease [Kofleriaceae bacterium]|jgi:hypothetical protein|nr:trypsin-like serine protease [Kofleriaceae bacterium]
MTPIRPIRPRMPLYPLRPRRPMQPIVPLRPRRPIAPLAVRAARAGWLAGAVLGLVALLAAAPAQASPRIIGGTPTTDGEYPSVVALVIGGSNLCTGTLITSTWVLTAAHCVDPMVLGLGSQDEVTAAMTVHFHTLNVLDDQGTVVTAAATFGDPMFDQAHLGSHDIGLIQLSTDVTDVQPSPINLFANMAPAGIDVTTVGYGAQAGGMGAAVGAELELKARPTVPCDSLGIGSDTNLLCFSQADRTGTCQGDSGGPSFAFLDGQQVVVGVTSFGDDGCAKFGASTRVDIEQPFLVQHVSELIGCLQDTDCPIDRVCFNHNCISTPFSPNGIGSTCNTANDCESSECAESSQDGSRCSITCSVSASGSCPGGFDCLRATGDIGACWPSANAGCCDAGGAGGPGAMLLGIGVMVVALRRRRG